MAKGASRGLPRSWGSPVPRGESCLLASVIPARARPLGKGGSEVNIDTGRRAAHTGTRTYELLPQLRGTWRSPSTMSPATLRGQPCRLW